MTVRRVTGQHLVDSVARDHVESIVAFASAAWRLLDGSERAFIRASGGMRVLLTVQCDAESNGVYFVPVVDIDAWLECGGKAN